MSATAPIVRAEGEGPRRWFHGGGTHTWKVTSKESGGGFFVFLDELTQGKMTPLHSHPDVEETSYVLEGTIRTVIDGVEHEVGRGGMTFVPRGVQHAFTVTSPTARLLVMQSPGSAGAFYWGASEPATGDGDGPVDFADVQRVAQATGATAIVGPPPFAPA